jgi:hypothetical protein
MFERYQGVVDQLAIRTNTSQTPDPAGTLADILSTLPADVVLNYQVVAGTVWDDAKASSWTVTKAKDWDTLMSGLTGWDHYERPQ